jgi:hypothetical protein
MNKMVVEHIKAETHNNGPMTLDHGGWTEFRDRLENACAFQLAVPGETTWACDCSEVMPLTRHILDEMGLTGDEVEESIEYLRANGGFCDCEVLLNVGHF